MQNDLLSILPFCHPHEAPQPQPTSKPEPLTYRQQLRQLRRTIGQNIHQARTQKRLTLRQLSRATGIPEHKLDQYELGKNEISIEELISIEHHLHSRSYCH
ncbi:helix-turn-helix domain-containing protein [bacterium]|nr:helix-turn-helix domain-containing protein [bacterium]